MGERSDGGGAGSEDEHERLDRNFSELLQELRVAQPGVQVLFAFLLTVPFAQGFERATDFQRDVYGATLALSAIATACLIAPGAAHRLLFRHHQKRWLVFTGNRLAIAGLAALALAMLSAMLLVCDYLFSRTLAWAVFAAGALLFGLLWAALPLSRRRGDEPD